MNRRATGCGLAVTATVLLWAVIVTVCWWAWQLAT